MRTITGLIWNVETFGTNTFPQFPGVQIDFIDYLRRSHEASFLVIQEFRNPAIDYLRDLKIYLDEKSPDPWVYDWVKGAINNLPAGGAAAATTADTAFVGSANSEGYAVFWAHDAGAPILRPVVSQTSYGASAPLKDRPHYIGLVTQGPRVIFPDPSAPPPPPRPVRNIQSATDVLPGRLPTYAFGFPGPNVHKYQRPSTSTTRTRSSTAPAPPPDPNHKILSLTNVRLPVRINLSSGAGSIPLIIYHAPNGNESSKYAAAACGLAGEVSDPGHGPVVVGGDFNLSHHNEREVGFANFQHFGLVPQTKTGGHYDRTMVHPTTGPAGHKLLLPLNGNPLTSARDQLFARGVTVRAAGTGVLQVLTDLSTAKHPLAKRVIDHTHTKSIMADLLRDKAERLIEQLRIEPNDPQLPAVINSLRRNFPSFGEKRELDHFESPLTAAIYYSLLISDHLPLKLTIDVA